MRFRYQIVMAYQRGPSDDSGTSNTRTVSIEEFQTLTQRVAAQERQLDEILAILRASVVVALVPFTAIVTVTQEANILGVTTMTLLPTTTATRLVMAVVPRAPTKIAPATPTVYGTTATTEVRQWREFKRVCLWLSYALVVPSQCRISSTNHHESLGLVVAMPSISSCANVATLPWEILRDFCRIAVKLDHSWASVES
ncbi:hypothetical protein Sjap_004977 [Stephania japonica]|uniref:Uncharacterized protein n=1 Tax=Stephania japonica TaxID=461633 RepID=A0AAP0PJL3_9MAGN